MNWEGLAEMVQAAAALQATVREPRWRAEDRVWRTEDRQWRHEDRSWRKQDLSWRQEEQEFMYAFVSAPLPTVEHVQSAASLPAARSPCCQARTHTYAQARTRFVPNPRHRTAACRRSQRHWRGDDLQQRTLDNARVLWNRFTERNRRDVEERAEQLKSIGNIAALVAGFAVVAFLEFAPPKAWGEFSPALTIAFGFTTALVVRCPPQCDCSTRRCAGRTWAWLRRALPITSRGGYRWASWRRRW